MNINDLIANVKKKLKQNINTENLLIEDKTFLHRNHKGHKDGKFHIKITIKSTELKKLNKIQSTKKIYSILNQELKTHVHSIQILIN